LVSEKIGLSRLHKNKEEKEVKKKKKLEHEDTYAQAHIRGLRVDFLLKTDSGYPKDEGVLYSPWQPLKIPFAITPIGQLNQSPPSLIPGDLFLHLPRARWSPICRCGSFGRGFHQKPPAG